SGSNARWPRRDRARFRRACRKDGARPLWPAQMNLKPLMGSLLAVGLIGVVLFGSAGRIDIPAFWVYVLALAGVTVIGLLVIDPDLVQERMRPGGQPLPTAYWLLGLLPL